MTKQETITKFELYMDDTTELSSQEESDLYDKVLDAIYRNRPWEILKTSYTATQSTSLAYIDLPANFAFFVQNHNYSEINADADGPVVFVGSAYTPYKIVSWSDRRQYRNRDGFCYVDIANMRLYFTVQPATAQSIEFDYYGLPTHLGLTESPVFPEDFHDTIYHGMCIEDNIIQQSDKAKSYAAENKTLYDNGIKDIAFWNANLIQIN